MEAIVLPAGRRAADEWVHENTTALFAAVFFYVTMRVKALTSGTEVNSETYVPLRKDILDALAKAREEVEIKNADEEQAWSGWSAVKPKAFDEAVAKAKERGWLDSDWYRGITDVVKTADSMDVLMADDEDVALAPAGQVRRADTMFQDRFDYLSEGRRTEYKAWKEQTLARISQAMASNSAMEVDPA
jgi:origin recognition complex subunit 6